MSDIQIIDAAPCITFDESKASQLLGIGDVWLIEDRYAEAALANLSALPVADCIRFAVEARKQEELEVEAAAARKTKGEREPQPYDTHGRTALIPVKGTMTKRPTSWGGASTQRISQRLQFAETDPDVDQVLMIFETPGGEARGCAEFADQIRQTNSVKPVYAYIEDQCASAGYLAASQCAAIYMNRMGWCGCIGSLSSIADYSANAGMRGIKVYKFTSEGSETYKGAGVDGTEITPAHRAYFQSIVDHYGNDFKAAVQLGRGLTDEQVRAVATGKMFHAQEALALGLLDGICSLDECLQTISEGSPSDGSPRKGAATAASNGNNQSTQGDNHMADNEKPGLGTRLMAFLKGEGIDVDAGGGSTTGTVQKTVVTEFSPELQAQLEQTAESQRGIALTLAKASAKDFATKMTKGPDAKATPAEFAAIENLYLQALSADGSGSPQLKDGALLTGEAVKAVEAAYEQRPKLGLTTQTLGDTTAKELDPNGGGAKEITPERRKELLGKSGVGRQVLAKEGK